MPLVLTGPPARPAPLPPCPLLPPSRLQKYYHKGAFFQGDDQEEVLGDVLKRSYDGATGEDRFNKEALPKIMQVGWQYSSEWQPGAGSTAASQLGSLGLLGGLLGKLCICGGWEWWLLWPADHV